MGSAAEYALLNFLIPEYLNDILHIWMEESLSTYCAMHRKVCMSVEFYKKAHDAAVAAGLPPGEYSLQRWSVNGEWFNIYSNGYKHSSHYDHHTERLVVTASGKFVTRGVVDGDGYNGARETVWEPTNP